MQSYHGIRPVFDDPNLVSDAGLVPLLALAESAGLSRLVTEHSTLPVACLPAKVRTVIAGMAAGADSIDDLDKLRAGANNQVIAGVRAPSTIGTFLRAPNAGGFIEQFGKINRLLLANLTQLSPGTVSDSELVFIDIDDTIRQVHGHKKAAAGIGYTKVRGLNAMITTVSAIDTAPVIAEFSLRKGQTSSGKGADRQIARTLSACKHLLTDNQQRMVRADSAFCTAANVAAVLKANAWFSITVKAWPTVKAAIATIPEDAWETIQYPNAVFDEETGQWESEAEVAEIPFTAFSSKGKAAIECRLVVRRVVRKHPLEDAGQGTLFTDYRHHAFITNSKFSTVDADRYHRGHAIVEQTIAELKAGPLAHFPSGKFHANAMWLALAVITFNLMRAAAHASHQTKARFQTIRRTIIQVPGRIARRARQIVLHLPTYWPWAFHFERLWDSATTRPATI